MKPVWNIIIPRYIYHFYVRNYSFCSQKCVLGLFGEQVIVWKKVSAQNDKKIKEENNLDFDDYLLLNIDRDIIGDKYI